MASLVQPGAGSSYQGLAHIFEFTNYDGCYRRTNCGQAACATFVTHHRQMQMDGIRASRLMDEIEGRFPPDNLGGMFGTSRRLVTRVCRAFGLKVHPVKGEQELRAELAQGNPVVVMLGVPGGRFLKWALPGGHWMVAYGFDEDYVYLTNWGWMTWQEFRAGWKGLVPRLISMRQCGLALTRQSE